MNKYNIEQEIGNALVKAYTHDVNASKKVDIELIDGMVCELIKLLFPQFLPIVKWVGNCYCGHTNERHGKSYDINYTAGKCHDCKCLNFNHNNK